MRKATKFTNILLALVVMLSVVSASAFAVGDGASEEIEYDYEINYGETITITLPEDLTVPTGKSLVVEYVGISNNVEVIKTFKVQDIFVHRVIVEDAEIKKGDDVLAKIDTERKILDDYLSRRASILKRINELNELKNK